MSDTTRYDTERSTADAAYHAGRSVTSHRLVLMIAGIVSVVAGVLAVAMPFLGSLTAALVTGGALIVSGLAGLFSAFRRHEGWHVAAAFGFAILSVVAGVAMFLQPLAGILALTTLIIAWFAASGALRVYYGVRMWGEGGGWMAAAGLLSVAVAVMLWAGLPFSAVWVPGLLLGVDLIFWGTLMIAFAIRAGRPARTPSAAA